MTALPHPPQNNPAPPARPEVQRRSPQTGPSDVATSERKSRTEPFREEGSLFDALLLTPSELPQPLIIPWAPPLLGHSYPMSMWLPLLRPGPGNNWSPPCAPW